MAVVCGECGFENPAGFRFCGSCGAALAPLAAGTRPAEPMPPASPERRQLTVMFCDLVGSTRLSMRLDPEELREVVRAYQHAAAAAIERYDGWIAQYLGDGILAYFGYPYALEYEAERAVRAALDVVAAVRRLDGGPASRLSVRIGIHTGVVVVGEVGGGGRREHLALGDTPNLAARLQSLAEPDTVVVSADTHRLITGRFECEPLGTPELKGVSRSEPVYRVVRERPERVATPAARLVGRDRELATLLGLWDRATTGAGQVAIVSGDPGLGKSYLVREFRTRIGIAPCAQLECRCLPYFQNTDYQPIIELIRAEAKCDPEQSIEDRLHALAGLLSRAGLPLEETVPLFAALLSLPPSEAWSELRLTSEARKARTREALLRLFLAMAETQPLLVVVEDVHWADPSTLELLGLLMDELGSARLLLVVTHRPGFEPPWSAAAVTTRIALGNLAADQVEGIVSAVTGGRALPPQVMRQIIDRTDGVPLFIEELTKMILESGLLREGAEGWEVDGPLPPLAIPTTLHDSLEARLDRLATVKEVAQVGATLGREFSLPLLRAVANVEEPVLRSALDQLVAADLLQVSGDPARPLYGFRHALIQEAAYQSLLRSTRQQHHRRIARALEGEFAASTAATPELIAHHYTAAGLSAEAARWWKIAGRRALQRSAHREAAAHLRAGLEQIAGIDDRARARTEELELLALLGPALIAVLGYIAPELERVFGRARDLCAGNDDPALLGPVLAGIFAFHFVRGEQSMSEVVATELMAAAERTGDGLLTVTAWTATGLAQLVRGDFAASVASLERVIRDYDRERYGDRAFAYGQDIGVVGIVYLALGTHMLGRPAAARRLVEEGIVLADAVRHPHSQAAALSIAGTLLYLQRDVETVRTWGARLDALCVEHGFDHWRVEAGMLNAWVAANDGRTDDALAGVAASRALAKRRGTDLRDRFYAVLGDTLRLCGRAAEGIESIASLRAGAAARNERWWWQADIDRIQGELLLSLDPNADAEPWFESSLEIGRSLDSPTLVLRASLALAGLWADRGDPDRGRELVRAALAAMPEPPADADLADARARLGRAISV